MRDSLIDKAVHFAVWTLYRFLTGNGAKRSRGVSVALPEFCKKVTVKILDNEADSFRTIESPILNSLKNGNTNAIYVADPLIDKILSSRQLPLMTIDLTAHNRSQVISTFRGTLGIIISPAIKIPLDMWRRKHDEILTCSLIICWCDHF